MSAVCPNLSGAFTIKNINTWITEKAVAYYGVFGSGTVSKNFGGLNTPHDRTCVNCTQPISQYGS